jgi:hypothetical protein
MNYDLNQLNPNEFEQLIQSLLKKIIGQGTTTFGQGPDGGREATYEGSAPYPSETNRWNGTWIFQAKFHNTYENAAPARKKVLYELENELAKIKTNFRTCDNYILATNVSLTSVRGTGTLDRMEQIKTRFRDKIRNIHVWGYQEIRGYLDQHQDIRSTYSHFVNPGDAMNALIQGKEDESRRKHQNEDIKNIFECWHNMLVYPVRYLYGSSYPPCFEDFYSQVSDQIDRCDPHNEAIMHLKTGYRESAFKKYKSLQNKVIKHNRKVARYVIDNRRDIKNYISKNVPSVKECGDNEVLVLNSYYPSNVIVYLRNIARGSQNNLSSKVERVNGIDGVTLCTNGDITLAFGSERRISKLSSFLEEYVEPFNKAYKEILLSLNEIDPLLSDFQTSIRSLIPKAKYGHVKGNCEFEEIDNN